uniref:Uncharacterized protein n=1 Tax=Arundo donax TaxID=35708 RepID=A0A0A9D7N2_ARUDO
MKTKIRLPSLLKSPDAYLKTEESLDWESSEFRDLAHVGVRRDLIDIGCGFCAGRAVEEGCVAP